MGRAIAAISEALQKSCWVEQETWAFTNKVNGPGRCTGEHGFLWVSTCVDNSAWKAGKALGSIWQMVSSPRWHPHDRGIHSSLAWVWAFQAVI